jgi:cyclase
MMSLRPRIVVSLLLSRGGLVKTRGFAEPKYVGDPINAVRIFNEKEVDELFVADIDATSLGREPDYSLISSLAAECRMPLCYAGGVKTPEQVERIINLGVEKVAISSAAVDNPSLIGAVAERVGSQSVVVVLDVRATKRSGYEVFTHNGTRATGTDAAALAARAEAAGAGEIVVNSIDRDGGMTGYDIALVEKIRGAVSIPLTALGGAASLEDIARLIQRLGIIGAAAGSLFVFKGRFRAVLINYPTRAEKDALWAIAGRA